MIEKKDNNGTTKETNTHTHTHTEKETFPAKMKARKKWHRVCGAAGRVRGGWGGVRERSTTQPTSEEKERTWAKKRNTRNMAMERKS
jgi:hypothetical protein